MESRLDLQIVDAEYGTMDQQSVALVPDAAVDAAVIRVPLVALPDGKYVLRLLPAWTDDVVLESEFVVSWRIERALQARDDVMMEAELVLGPREFARFRRMSRSAQVQTMQDFWEERDPTPGTPRNELYDRFLARVAHAARFYGDHQRPGPLTDRGKIYIRYGAPSTIDVEVIPSSGIDLDEAIGQVHDAFAMDVAGTNIRGELSESGLFDTGPIVTEADRDRRRNQARIGQEGSFELWRYDSDGDPLFEDGGALGREHRSSLSLRRPDGNRSLRTGLFQPRDPPLIDPTSIAGLAPVPGMVVHCARPTRRWAAASAGPERSSLQFLVGQEFG